MGSLLPFCGGDFQLIRILIFFSCQPSIFLDFMPIGGDFHCWSFLCLFLLTEALYNFII